MIYSVLANQYLSKQGCFIALAISLSMTGYATAQNTPNEPASGALLSYSGENTPLYNDRVQRHFYASAGIGASRLTPDASANPSLTVDDRVEPTGQATLGLDFNHLFSFEVHTADLGSAGFSQGGRLDYQLHGASALLYAGGDRDNFKRRGVSGYGRLGVGHLVKSEVGGVPLSTDDTTHVLLGAGVEYMTQAGLGLRAEAVAVQEDVQYAQIGVVYRTGNPTQRVRLAKALPVAMEPVAGPCDGIEKKSQQVNFETNSAQLTVSATHVLDEVADLLAKCETTPLRIAAHTDSVGEEAFNMSLSKKRALSVVKYLNNRDVDIDRLSARGFGESQPIATNDTPEGRRQNRRVELITN